MTEIANAYITLQTKMPGVKSDIQKGLGGADAEFDKAGRSFGSSLLKGIGGVAVAGVAAVGAIAAVGLGTALTKGFQRLDSLDQATAKLEGLGHSAGSVEQIMQNALASVRGTAFGMDEAAGVAAGVVAAGVKPGMELERTLKLVADASTIAGTSMGDMGAIFNKVAGTGKIQGEVIAQLGERGIPILQLLAEEMGVSAGEVQKLAASGEINFERFQNAMERGMGGAALKSGETLRGSLANFQSSLGRIGAGLLGGTFEQLAPTFQAMTSALGPLEAVAAELGDKIGAVLLPAFEAFRDILSGGFDISPFAELLGYLSPLGLAFQIIRPILPVLADAFGQIAGVIGGVLADVLPVVAKAFTAVALVVSNVLAKAIPVLIPVIVTLVELLGGLASQVLPILLPVIAMLADLFAQVLVAVMPIVEVLISALVPILQAIIPVVMTVLGAFMPLISALVEALAPILTTVADIIAAGLVPVLDTIITVVKWLAEIITWFVTNVVVPYFTNVLIPAVKIVGDIFGEVFGGLGDFFAGIWKGIEVGFKAFINFIIDGINGFLGGLNEVGNFLSDATGGAVDFSIGKIPRLGDGATVLPRAGGTLAVLAERGRAESVVDTGLMNRALEDGIAGKRGSTVVQHITVKSDDPRLQMRQWAREAEGAFASS